MEADTDERRPRHRGLGFFPDAVVIRDANPGWRAAQQPADAWTQWKAWHTNSSGHGGQTRAPPVFVRAEKEYDELGRSVADGFGVDVDDGAEGVDETEGKEKGSDVADWYRSLSRASGGSTPRPGGSPKPEVAPKPDAVPPLEPPEPATTTTTAPPAVAETAPAPAPAPLRVHRSEWFIRRALASKAASAAPAPAPPPRSSIGALLNIDAARPPPKPRPVYALGPENAGYGRLAALGWGGGGLGRVVGDAPPAERRKDDAPAERKRAVVEPDGTVDLTADSDSESDSDVPSEPEPPSGPGRTTPIATALKLDRAGLGRRAPPPKVTHTPAEIEAAQRRARRHKAPAAEPGKKQKVKWAQRERQERESRKRIAALLNA
ncbi:hypothetical protein Q8F55_000520 [Vanrija albida]|uniref:G-patch domain-containing protein n=1 Tax=Vanrija albida TaxID=181172 RepID=A0ABR3QE17_9TREE